MRPSTTLNYQAATRFIEHSLPDLTHGTWLNTLLLWHDCISCFDYCCSEFVNSSRAAQRKSMKGIARGEGPRIKYTDRSAQKKRKFQSSEKMSVQTAAKEFLEKASRELLGDTQGGFKGPLQIDASDKDDQPMDWSPFISHWMLFRVFAHAEVSSVFMFSVVTCLFRNSYGIFFWMFFMFSVATSL